MTAAAPLAGTRVIDLGTRVAAPYCAAILGELGADVIKIEDPRGGDMLRGLGPFVDDSSLFFAVEGRSRRSVTCNLRDPRGQALARRLIATADVVCENFRPGTLERWNLGPDDLPPQLIMVRVSILGQSGPDAARPGLDLTAIAMAGLLSITGYPDEPPVKSAVTVADHLTAVFAAQSALAALVARRRTGRGAVIDVPLHGSVLRCLEVTLAAFDRLGVERVRTGDRGPHEAPSGVYATVDGRFVAIAIDSDEHLRSLRALLVVDADRGELRPIVEAWIASHTAVSAVSALDDARVPAAVVASASDLTTDAHLAARGDIVTIDDTTVGRVRQQAPFPRLVPVAPTITPAPTLGQHNVDIWCDELGLTPDELDRHRGDGVI
ncbi:MAG TPA: CoA transferase [Acidimicrobiales bacterium]|nr:CoA transferase [Acidimicrobiales bacterium]